MQKVTVALAHLGLLNALKCGATTKTNALCNTISTLLHVTEKRRVSLLPRMTRKKTGRWLAGTPQTLPNVAFRCLLSIPNSIQLNLLQSFSCSVSFAGILEFHKIDLVDLRYATSTAALGPGCHLSLQEAPSIIIIENFYYQETSSTDLDKIT